MTPSEIKPGMKFGHLEVIKFDHINKHRIKYFLCKCEVCGKLKAIRGTSLISGQATACCRKCAEDLTGLQFGEWKVLKRDPNKDRYYICECSCGTIKSIFGSSLKNGASKSCGCLKNKNTSQRHLNKVKTHIGEKYGLLTIESYEKRGQDYWYKCKCDCGNYATVLGKRLFRGETNSCGCLNSKANELMDKILTSKNVPFKREVRFEDCRDKSTLPFDFGIYNENDELLGLIELNGSLHYSSSGTGWDTPERLIYQQKHDYIKREFCEKSRIPFLVIPYQYFNELEKFLITSDFWKIITKNFND